MRSSSPHPQGYYPWQFQGSSSKSLGRVVWQSKKRTQKILLFYLWWPPRYAPKAKFLLHCILLFITFDLICIMTMFVQNGFWTLWGYSPLALPPGFTSKFQMCSSSLRGRGGGRHTRVLQKVLSLGSDYFNATFYQTYFYYKPSKYSPFTETHFCNLFTQSRKADK